MKHIFWAIFFHFIISEAYCQKSDDTKIIVTVGDTANLYTRVKRSFTDLDLMIKPDDRKDTVSMYLTEMKWLGCFVRLKAIIQGNKVTYSGGWVRKVVDPFGVNLLTDDDTRIIYYKGSLTWKLMDKVAHLLGGEIAYSK